MCKREKHRPRRLEEIESVRGETGVWYGSSNYEEACVWCETWVASTEGSKRFRSESDTSPKRVLTQKESNICTKRGDDARTRSLRGVYNLKNATRIVLMVGETATLRRSVRVVTTFPSELWAPRLCAEDCVRIQSLVNDERLGSDLQHACTRLATDQVTLVFLITESVESRPRGNGNTMALCTG